MGQFQHLIAQFVSVFQQLKLEAVLTVAFPQTFIIFSLYKA